jgi:hypothetical protein
MKFQSVKTAIIALLATGATANGYSVVGAQSQSQAAEKLANLAEVEVVFGDGDFPKSRGGMGGGSLAHDAMFKVVIAVAMPAVVDIATLESPTATPVQRAAALTAAVKSDDATEAKIDAVAAAIWNLIMRPANWQFGQTAIKIANRWISAIHKNDPGKFGSYGSKTGTMDISCTFEEIPTQETPVVGAAVDNTVNLTSDLTGAVLDSAKQGAKVGT